MREVRGLWQSNQTPSANAGFLVQFFSGPFGSSLIRMLEVIVTGVRAVSSSVRATRPDRSALALHSRPMSTQLRRRRCRRPSSSSCICCSRSSRAIKLTFKPKVHSHSLVHLRPGAEFLRAIVLHAHRLMSTVGIESRVLRLLLYMCTFRQAVAEMVKTDTLRLLFEMLTMDDPSIVSTNCREEYAPAPAASLRLIPL